MMSTVTPMVTEAAIAVRAGADLREARERLGLTLDDVAFTLRIRLPHLEALEEGRISLLPGNAYALAFVRTYAAAIGLDAEEMARRFKTEAAEFSRRPDLVFPVPMPERGFPAGALVLLGLVLVVSAYAGWYRLSGEGRLPAETVTAVPERLAPLAEQAIPPVAAPPASVPSAPKVGLADPVADDGHATERATGEHAADVAQSRPSQADPAQIAAIPNLAPPVQPISPTSAAAAQLPFRPSDTVTSVPLAPTADAGRILLHASADAWLMVKDHTGNVLLNRVLKTGEVWPVPPRTDLLLTTGNAGGTDVLVDGAVTASLGSNGAVRRDLPLDPDQIKDGKLVVTPMPSVAAIHARQQ